MLLKYGLFTVLLFCCTAKWLSYLYFDDGLYDPCEVIPHCGFDLHFPNSKWCWESFLRLLTICMSQIVFWIREVRNYKWNRSTAALILELLTKTHHLTGKLLKTWWPVELSPLGIQWINIYESFPEEASQWTPLKERVTECKMPGNALRGRDVVSMGNILTNPKTTVLRDDINLLIERSHWKIHLDYQKAFKNTVYQDY